MSTLPASEPSLFHSNTRLELRDAPSGLDPYPHQLTTWDKMTRLYLEQGRPAGLVVLPTGGGKTVVAAHWLLRNVIAKGGRVLWLAHRQSLLRQAFKTFRRLGNLAYPERKTLDLIAVSSEFHKWSAVSPDHHVIFASIQSSVMASNRGFVTELLADASAGAFVVVDEAHHAVAPQTLKLLEEIKAAGVRLLGLTATPIRTDEADQKRLGNLFDGTVIHQVSRTELSNLGILAVPATETVKTEVNVEKDMDAAELKYLDRYGDLAPNVLARLGKNAHRNALIVEQYVRNRDKYGPTIVFAADTLHAQTLAGEFQKRGVEKVDYVDYSRKNASEIIDRYVRRELDVIVNVQMLTEGFDAPHTRTVFIARPTRSESLVVQMVGRALRGRRAGGNDVANLVTFLDTWNQYDVLGGEYVLEGGTVEPPTIVDRPYRSLVVIPPELIRDAYRLLQSNVKGQLVGVHACLPHGWYRWEEVFEDDVQSKTVMVFDTQREALEGLLASYAAPESIPESIAEDDALTLIRRHFCDTPDPLPRWADVKALLDAKRKGCDLAYVTFEEKRAFDPADLAKRIIDERLDAVTETELLERIWAENAACAIVYRHDEAAFREEVGRERTRLINARITKPKTDPVVLQLTPSGPPRPWAAGQAGRSLQELMAAVIAVKRHFPNGAPMLGELRWMAQARTRLWGFFRYEDKCVALNPLLDSPDVPRFVVEFVLFHELLHADAPSAGHNADFRARERQFLASPSAREEAQALGLVPGPSAAVDYWRVRAEMFLDTFERYFQWKQPGTAMAM
jgi:superfamily II DNA or RNA helicase